MGLMQASGEPGPSDEATAPLRPPAGPVALALDVGGTKLATAVVDLTGQPYGLLIEPTRRDEGPDAVLARLFDLGARSLQAAGVAAQRPVAVGIACGGPLDPARGTIHDPPNLPGWHDIALGPRAAAHFTLPFVLENDASAAALATYHFGAGRGLGTVLYLTLSTGIGGGLVIDGRLHRGAAGNGGEVGHLTVVRNGLPCPCGRRGCLERHCSGTNIAARARAALEADRTPSMLRDLADVTAADVSGAAAAGDPVATAVWDETTSLLGQALCDLTNILEPDLIALGGGVTRAGAHLLDPVRAAVATAMPPAARAVRVDIVDDPDLAGVRGAGAIALEPHLTSMSHQTSTPAKEQHAH